MPGITGRSDLEGRPKLKERRLLNTVPARAHFRFYAELNDHLPPNHQYRPVEREFYVPSSVKDMIEGFGVPHTEVELVLVNGESADFSHLVRDGDSISVYPMFESMDITPMLRLRRQPLREPKFVLDVHLGKLAAYLRMLGFDTFYRNCASDAELARISAEEQRTLLTRDRGLLKHSAVTHGYWLRETDSKRQTEEVVKRFDLIRSVRPLTRCMACNELLRGIPETEVAGRVPSRVLEWCHAFRECADCRRVYWSGSHYRRMQRWIDDLSLSIQPGAL